MNKHIKILIFAFALLSITAQAQIETIEYPVAELGGCESEEACKPYCDRTENMEKCVAFAEKHNLLSREEIEKGKKFVDVLKKGGGPGGCRSESACWEFCNDTKRIKECVSFAEENGFMAGEELAEAKKIESAIGRGVRLPGDCRNRQACESYCKNIGHIDECFAFAKENGLIGGEELVEAEKMIPLIKNGQTPGGCKSKDECEAYCGAEEHFNVCMDFAAKNGLVGDKELEIMKKTGGRGPGGCRGRACATFCEKPENKEACFQFARENNLISEADLKKMDEGMKFMRESLEGADPRVKECVEKIIGAPGLTEGEDSGRGLAFSGPEVGEKMRACFEGILPAELKGQFKFEGTKVTGPGGCKSHEECEAYCKANPEACGIKSNEFIGPGGCRSREECEAFCRENPEKCGITPHDGESAPGPQIPPPEFRPPEGMMQAPPPEFQKQYEEQYRQKYEEQYRQQYEEQYRMQYQQYQQQEIPPGSLAPSDDLPALLFWPLRQLRILINGF